MNASHTSHHSFTQGHTMGSHSVSLGVLWMVVALSNTIDVIPGKCVSYSLQLLFLFSYVIPLSPLYQRRHLAMPRNFKSLKHLFLNFKYNMHIHRSVSIKQAFHRQWDVMQAHYRIDNRKWGINCVFITHPMFLKLQ